jgi:hypothetical protein
VEEQRSGGSWTGLRRNLVDLLARRGIAHVLGDLELILRAYGPAYILVANVIGEAIEELPRDGWAGDEAEGVGDLSRFVETEGPCVVLRELASMLSVCGRGYLEASVLLVAALVKLTAVIA